MHRNCDEINPYRQGTPTIVCTPWNLRYSPARGKKTVADSNLRIGSSSENAESGSVSFLPAVSCGHRPSQWKCVWKAGQFCLVSGQRKKSGKFFPEAWHDGIPAAYPDP